MAVPYGSVNDELGEQEGRSGTADVEDGAIPIVGNDGIVDELLQEWTTLFEKQLKA